MTQKTNHPAAPAQNAGSDKDKASRPSKHYQDALDESLEETFPASDPIAPSTDAARNKPTGPTKR